MKNGKRKRMKESKVKELHKKAHEKDYVQHQQWLRDVKTGVIKKK